MKKMNFKSAAFELEGGDEKQRMVKGYASVFGNLDSDSDTIQKGAFKRTIKAWGPDGANRIKLVSQHNISEPVGKITMLKEDDNGLYMEAQFGTHTAGEDHYRMVKEGILTEFSIGFTSSDYDDNDDGGYNFKEIKLYEVSLVTVASNDEALVTGVKTEDIVEELNDKLPIDSKQKAQEVEALLLKLATSFDSTQSVEDTPGSQVETKSDDLTDLLTNLNDSL